MQAHALRLEVFEECLKNHKVLLSHCLVVVVGMEGMTLVPVSLALQRCVLWVPALHQHRARPSHWSDEGGHHAHLLQPSGQACRLQVRAVPLLSLWAEVRKHNVGAGTFCYSIVCDCVNKCVYLGNILIQSDLQRSASSKDTEHYCHTTETKCDCTKLCCCKHIVTHFSY